MNEREVSENRIIELEIKVAYQDDLVQELNKIVIQQQDQLDNLAQMCRLLSERLNQMIYELGDNNGQNQKFHLITNEIPTIGVSEASD